MTPNTAPVLLTDAGQRTVAIPELVTQDLAAHVMTYPRPGDDGLVFACPEAIGRATGTTTAARVMTARVGPAAMPPNLGFKLCTPTATRTRDLLLRRHFRSVAW
jgi:hypothetical protein